MKLTVLVDNNTFIDRYFQGEPAVSYFIECEGKNYLFDMGYSELFLRNANKMGINLKLLDTIIVSHGHNDHTWGLGELVKFYTEAACEGYMLHLPTIVAHPDAFLEKREQGILIGSMLATSQLESIFSLHLSRNPVKLSDKLIFLGEIERSNSFEGLTAIGETQKDGVWEKDYILDDSALVYMSELGLVIITGCSHAGICNIIEYAKKVCNVDKICDVIGGFHLLSPSQCQMNGTIEYFKRQQVGTVHAGHCTDLHSKIKLSQVADIKDFGVGLVLEY